MYDITKIADGTEDVRLWRPGSDYEARVERALYRPERTRGEAKRDRVVPEERGYWYLPEHEDVRPMGGDRIDDSSGDDWLVEKVVYSRLAGNWRCAAGRYAVTFGIDEFVDVLEPVYAKSAAGVLAERHLVRRTGIAAKFSGETEDREDGRRVYMLSRERISVPKNGLLRRGDGTFWEIVRLRENPYEGGWNEAELRQAVES